MSFTDTVLVVLIALLVGFLLFKKKPFVVKKSAHIKKNEIEEGYKVELYELIEKYKENEIKCKEEKVKFIKNANYELNKNIFFTQDEIKKIIYELTKI